MTNHVEVLREMFAVCANERRMKEADALDAAITALSPPSSATPGDGGPPCNTHPDAPHGFDRNASHSVDRYVCDCEGWVPPDVASLIVRDVCETEPADPDEPDTVCVSVKLLTEIVSRHLPQERVGSDAGAQPVAWFSTTDRRAPRCLRIPDHGDLLVVHSDSPAFDGELPLYTRPQPAIDASGGDVADLIAKYEVRERNFAGLPHNEWATGNHQQIQDFLADLHTLSRTLAESRAELTAWHEMVVAAHANRDALWPNNWPQNVAWIAHCLHTRSVPPVAAQQQEGKP